MSLKKRFFATLVALTFVLSGCGGGSTGGDDAAALLEKSSAAMAEVTSMNSKIDMDFVMESGDQEVSLLTTIDAVTFLEPMKMQMSMGMSMGGTGFEDSQAVEMDMYAQESEGKLISYVQMDGAWYATSATEDMMAQYNAGENATEFLDILEKPSISGTEDVNGVSTSCVSGVLTGEAMKESVEKSGMLTTASSLGLTEEQMNKALEEMGELPISLWIGEDGYVYRYEMDMTLMMQGIFDAMQEAYSDGGVVDETQRLFMKKALVTMTADSYNAATDFEIPAEALEADVVEE